MRRAALSCSLAAIVAAAGCRTGPPANLEACRNRAQALQAEVAQLKDESLRLRARNRELVRQAADEAERVRVIEAENVELRGSLAGFQRERDELARSFDELKEQLRAEAVGLRSRP